MSAATLLSVQGATKHFGGLTAVDGVGFDVQRNQIVGVIGPNGAGKSTLFNLVSGLLPLSAGKVVYEGTDMGAVPAYGRSAIGMTRTFQIVRQFGHLPVIDNVMIGGHASAIQGFFASLLKLPLVLAQDRALRAQALEWLQFVGLEDRADHIAAHLPHGQQRLLEIARAMIGRPKLLLLDEPAAGLNGTETANLLALLRKTNQQGTAILIVEHDIKFIMSLCERIVVMDHGARIAEGTPEQIRHDEAVIDAYLGKRAAHVED